jgi:hypothetical protein
VLNLFYTVLSLCFAFDPLITFHDFPICDTTKTTSSGNLSKSALLPPGTEQQHRRGRRRGPLAGCLAAAGAAPWWERLGDLTKTVLENYEKLWKNYGKTGISHLIAIKIYEIK